MSLLNQSSLIDTSSQSRYQPSRFSRALVLLVCAFLAFCTSVGPLYRIQASIANFGILNGVLFAVAFIVYWALIKAVARFVLHERSTFAVTVAVRSFASKIIQRLAHTRIPHWIRRISSSKKSLFITLLLGWLWVPLFLNVSFGADLQGQATEVSNWLSQLSGNSNTTALYHTLFTQADVYPIAHYLWPMAPTFLTNQHNIALTLLYGLIIKASETAFTTAIPGILLLGFAQYAFAAYCLAATAHRFFHLRSNVRLRTQALVVVIMLASPMITLSTISLTKSPLFGFASVWWIGVLYEVLHTKADVFLPRSTRWELMLSAVVMLLSAKYAVYIIVAEAVVLFFFSHKSWKTWCTYLVVPVVIFEIALLALVHTGTIMDGDSIESKSLQVQQIARVAKYNPSAISADARKKLEPIFNITNMGSVYFQSDADPVKSSGALGKVTSYRWKTVSEADWKNFNSAWVEIGKAAPTEYIDAFFAEFYGYFDVADEPYVPMLYYSDTRTVSNYFSSQYIGFAPRAAFLGFLRAWSEIPILGWFFHGNFWVILTLAAMCVELLVKRYRELLWQIPLLVQMAVMVAAPADNFDRHMIGIAATFAFVAFALLTTEKVPDESTLVQTNSTAQAHD